MSGYEENHVKMRLLSGFYCTDMHFKSKTFYAELRKFRVAFWSGRGRAISLNLDFDFSSISVVESILLHLSFSSGFMFEFPASS